MARPTISLQAAIGPGTTVTNPFIIGVSLIGGTDVIVGRDIYGQGGWKEIGDRAYSVSTRRGRQRQLEQFKAGTLSATLDNADGALDPAWLNGPYTESGATKVRAMAGVQLVATYAGVDYPIYNGYSDAWKPTPSYPEGGTTSVTATDAFKIFTKIDPLEQPFVGGGEATGARITRILDLAGWSASLRDLDVGNSTHQSTNLAQPIASQIRLAADSERGDLYISEDGRVTFRQRQSRYVSVRSTTVQWNIGDADGQLQPTVFEVANDDDVIYNDVNVARAGGSMVTVTDPLLSTYPYLRSSYNRTDLTLADDSQVVSYANQVYRTSRNTLRNRVDTVTFEPDGYDDLWPFVLGAKFGDRCTVSLTHPRTGVVFSGDYFIEGIDHDIPVMGPSGWVTKFYLSDASAYPTNPFIVGVSLIDGPDLIV